MNATPGAINILLAEDDADDCLLFSEALAELEVVTSLTTVSNGERLMDLLKNSNNALPDIVFLDINMPRKSGHDCLSEIMQDENLRAIPVIMYSTSLDIQIADLFYEMGARHYIRKPAEFSKLKAFINQALKVIRQTGNIKNTKEDFILQV